MHFLKRLLPLISLSIILLFHPAVGVELLNFTCSTPTIIDFSNNLNQLMFTLSSQTPTIGFGIGSVGNVHSRLNGLALCRGDVGSSNCKACLRSAGDHLRHHCPTKKEAIIWLDSCLLRYSHTKFFGEIDTVNKFHICNSKSLSDSETNHKMGFELMRRVKKEAYLAPLMYAAGDAEMGESERLYGLAQCSRDLSGGDCEKCLEVAIRDLGRYCGGKKGGTVVGASCTIRYELHPFFAV